jgi:hypothetical protein
MSSLFTGPQCFFIAILAFVVLGFRHGWRREVISLVFVLLATALVNSRTSDYVSSFLGRIPTGFAYLMGATPPPAQPVSFLGGPLWSLFIFFGVVILGYFIAYKVFPGKPAPPERFIGIIPGVISGAFILSYLMTYFLGNANASTLSFDLTSTDPIKYIPIIVIIAVLAFVVAMIATARAKKAAPKK